MFIKHNLTKTKTYQAWSQMKQRCLNAKHRRYKDYGARGITICPEWLHDFLRFLADMGECPPGLSLDRKDNDGNYEPNNCRWATAQQQAANRRIGSKQKPTHCPHDHEYTPENTYINSRGAMECKICRAGWFSARNKRKNG